MNLLQVDKNVYLLELRKEREKGERRKEERWMWYMLNIITDQVKQDVIGNQEYPNERNSESVHLRYFRIWT